MKKYRVFEVNDMSARIHGIVELRLDSTESDIFKMARKIGLNLNKRRNKVIWWDDDYAEIINKISEKTIGTLEVCN